jgi:hypothetical protein
LSAFMTPEEISQFMTAIDDEQKEEEQEEK